MRAVSSIAKGCMDMQNSAYIVSTSIVVLLHLLADIQHHGWVLDIFGNRLISLHLKT